MNWNAIWQMAGMGALLSLAGWWKNASADGKFTKYELKYGAYTIVLGALVGVVAGVKGIELTDAKALLAGTGLLALGSQFLKGAYRHKLLSVFEDLKLTR